MPKILVVEDNPVNLELVRDLLENYGYNVFTASNGLDALDLSKKVLPDLILMDLQLPGMGGLTATRLIKEDPNTTHIPIVALTAFAMNHDEVRARNAGCVGFITKPINTREFPKLVASFLK